MAGFEHDKKHPRMEAKHNQGASFITRICLDTHAAQPYSNMNDPVLLIVP